jgi:gentisate 1,2-dioxygenase
MNSTTAGRTVRYTQYRDAFDDDGAQDAVHWSWSAILQSLSASTQGERGSLTLSKSGEASGCELLPGMAITVQVVAAGSRTRPHAHSWWHLFVVRSGSGRAVLGRDEGEQDVRQLRAGDMLLLPAWTSHQFDNGGAEDLILLSISNLPQQAALANHRAIEPQ